MQLTATTDYATRIICCLAENKEMTSAAVLSSQLDIPMGYIFKVTKLLKQAGLITSLDGLKGGYALAKEPHEITLLEIVMATEKTMHIIKHFEDENDCNLESIANCKIKSFYHKLQTHMHRQMLITVNELI